MMFRIESDRLGSKGEMTKSISGYVNTNIPVLAEMIRNYGPELKKNEIKWQAFFDFRT